jgi:ABC-type transporter Mla subunit MlaD
MPAGRFSRNTVLAGVFVLAMIGLFVFGVVLLTESGDWSMRLNRYTIRFSLLDGAEGLEKGSAVKLGGKRVGRVRTVEFDPKPETGRDVEAILVEIEVDSSLKVYEDADITLVRPLLGTNSSLNIVRLRGEPATKQVAAGGTIVGKLAPPGFVSQADYAAVQNFLRRVDRWSGDIDKDWPKPYDDVKATVENVRKASADAEAIVSDARTRWNGWGGDIDQIFKTVKDRAESISKGADDAVKEARQFIDEVRKVVSDNRSKIDEALESARNIVKKFESEDYPAVAQAIKDGKATMAYAVEIARKADQVLTTRIPEINDIITNGSLAAQQVKLLSAEVRAAPWRLLYQPNKKELENELLYNSIRQYSNSLAEVRAAAQALEAATQAIAATPEGQKPAVDPETISALTVKLKDSVSKSAEQEKLFFDRWIREDRK